MFQFFTSEKISFLILTGLYTDILMLLGKEMTHNLETLFKSDYINKMIYYLQITYLDFLA